MKENQKNTDYQKVFDESDLKILICYTLGSLDEKVPATELSQLFHYEGIASYFDVWTAISDLEKEGCLEKSGKELYAVTEKGKALSYTLKESVSPILKKKVYTSALKMLKRYKSERDTDIEILKGDAGVTLTCSEKAGETVLFSFSIMLPDEAQALNLKEEILKDPKYYYDSFIKILTEK